METETIIALVVSTLAIVGVSIPMFKGIYNKVKTGGVSVETGEAVVEEFGSDINDFITDVTDLVNQAKSMSKAVDTDSAAKARINDRVETREALLKAAIEISPDTASALAEVLTPVPAHFDRIAGISVDKLTRIKEAQREKLSEKESLNKVLGDSGTFALKVLGLLKQASTVLKK